MPNQRFNKIDGMEDEKFRIEVFNDSGEKIYVCEFFGKLKIKELPDGLIQISGENELDATKNNIAEQL